MSFFRRGSRHLLTGLAISILFTGGTFAICVCAPCTVYVWYVIYKYICNIYIYIYNGSDHGVYLKNCHWNRKRMEKDGKGWKRMINLGNLSWLDKSMIYSLPHYHLKHVLVMYIGCPSCLPLCKAHLSFGQISVLSPFNIIQSCSIPQIVSKQTTIWTTCWIVAPNSPNVTHPPKN